MRFLAHFRSLLSALLLAAVLFGAATSECAACGFTKGVSFEPRECCLPDGSCSDSADMAGCVKSQPNNPAIVAQGTPLPQLAIAEFRLPVVVTYENLPAAEIFPYSTPPVHLLNSAFLI